MARTINPDKREEKRQEILDAAHNCFLRNGLQGASIAMICKEAAISPGHLYHYFPSKEAIVEAMAEDYLKLLHRQFHSHPEGQDTATVLLSELWNMKGWDDLAHCRILFELLAEAGRNDRVREILQENTTGIRHMLVQTLKDAQSKGQVDPSLDPEQTGAVLIAVLDAAPMLPLMAPGMDFEQCRQIITTMVRRFLQPQNTAHPV